MKGGAGPAELETAIACLSQDGTLDDNAQEVLRKSPPEAALTGLFSLLQMDPSNLRNPSAYVTRAVISCKREGGWSHDPGQHMGMGMWQGNQAQTHQSVGSMTASPGSGSGLLSKWLPQLDPEAQEKLQQVGPKTTQQILLEMDAKDVFGQVRNPSGYVSRACDNFHNGIAPSVAPSMQLLDSSPDLVSWHGVLDSEAFQALERIGSVKAAPILEKLQALGDQVRNPSAYVIKAIGNLAEGSSHWEGYGGYGSQTAHVATSAFGQRAHSQPRLMILASLDESALSALQEVGEEAGGTILLELESKGASIHNPSAYVTRAAQNIRRGEGMAPRRETYPGANGSGSNFATSMQRKPAGLLGGQQTLDLDDKALSALEEIGPDAAVTIVQQLEQLGDKVNNPSAYVLRAVNNAKAGKGAGGHAMVASAHSANSGMLDAWSQKLDENAMSALSSVMPDAAASVLSELESKWAEIKNPSAYVVRAVGNTKRGQSLQKGPSGSTWGAEMGQPFPQLQGAEMGQLDAKALIALQEVGGEASAVILQKLQAQSASITNPSAWVIRAVANAKNGPPADFAESLAKRMRNE